MLNFVKPAFAARAGRNGSFGSDGSYGNFGEGAEALSQNKFESKLKRLRGLGRLRRPGAKKGVNVGTPGC